MQTQSRSHAIDLLETMRSLINQGWTQCAAARDKFGQSVRSTDTNAVCWCLSGAFARANTDLHTPSLVQHAVYNKIRRLIGPVPNWNDRSGRTRDEVLSLIDYVLEYVRE